MRKMNIGVVIGTFLPFHKGHEALINFARATSDLTMVMISTRSIEPICGYLRLGAIEERFPWVLFNHHEDDNAPQNPKSENDSDFWNYWKDVLTNAVYNRVRYEIFCEWDTFENMRNEGVTFTLYSSESYGEKLASAMGWDYVNFDMNRDMYPVSGTVIRNNPLLFSDELNPYMAINLRKKYVMFGAESVGKTTTAEEITERLNVMCESNAQMTLEWARPFLMSQKDMSPSVENMHKIFKGQYALECVAENALDTHIATICDTDIMSTFGYAELVGMDSSEYINIKPRKEDVVYFVLSQDEVPFEEDVLRYGGDERETTDQYWIDLLEKEGYTYHVVTGNYVERTNFILGKIEEDINSRFNFERE